MTRITQPIQRSMERALCQTFSKIKHGSGRRRPRGGRCRSPVWGYAAPAPRRGTSDDDDKDERNDCLLLLTVCCLTTLILAPFYSYMLYHGAIPSFSVALAGYEGIDPARPARVVSPAFSLALRMNTTCVDRADVTVAYSGVALGWARPEPRDCAGERWGRNLEVVARGDGVGLSRRLRDRMASEWRSSAGTLELDVDVAIDNGGTGTRRVGGDDSRDKVVSCKVRAGGRERLVVSSPCTWYALDKYNYGVV